MNDDTNKEINNNPHQIFDKLFKIVMHLSNKAVIDFINSLYNKHFLADSEIVFNEPEIIKVNFDRIVADLIITVNKTEKFHIEVQTTKDDEIIIRVFDYGYGDALKYKICDGNRIKLNFPESKIIFLQHTKNTPDEFELEILIQNKSMFVYKVPVLKFLDYDIHKIQEQKMIIMLPFYLLKLRGKMSGKITPDKIQELKKLSDDIINSIDNNKDLNNITSSDANELKNLTWKLFNYLYGDIEEVKKEKEMFNVFDTSLYDKLYELEKSEKELKDELAKKNAEKNAELAKKDAELANNQKELFRILLLNGVPIDLLSKSAKLSPEELEKLK
jgi:hypothetical protein